MIDIKLERLKPEDFIPKKQGEEPFIGVPLKLDGELTFEEDVDPEQGGQFLATIKIVDGVPHLVDIEGIAVIGVEKPIKKATKAKEKKAVQSKKAETATEDEEDETEPEAESETEPETED